MSKKFGIIGCGDFLRWQIDDITSTPEMDVVKVYDPLTERAEKFAGLFDSGIAGSADEIIADADIDAVCIFVPPWIRKDLVVAAAKAGKTILTTKPLGANIEDCKIMKDAVKDTECGVMYRRTNGAVFEKYREIFNGGEIGKLALYKQDWLHHYPSWNQWATDPVKNGGPFMDAMIHNFNIARYLMGRKTTGCTYFSDNHSHTLPCSDTESMKLDFEGNGSAHLFITWAADLAVYSNDGNDREHIDVNYMITDRGWRVTDGFEDGKQVITASKDGKEKKWIVTPLNGSVYKRFIDMLEGNGEWPSDLPTVCEAYDDIYLLRTAEKNLGSRIDIVI